MKTRYIMGTVTIIAIVGGTIYAIKKHKDMEKLQEEAITADEAREIVEEHRKNTETTVKFTQDIEETDIDEEEDEEEEEEYEYDYEEVYVERHEPIDQDTVASIRDESHEMASWSAGFGVTYNGLDEDEDTDDKIGIFTEEDRKLRHEPNSVEAYKQFKRMELAELDRKSEVYQTILRLYDFIFEPKNDGDHMLYTQIIDYRVRFFGFSSRWAKHVTFADIILHYARAAQFNCDETVAYWIEYFLEYNDLWYQYASTEMDKTIELLNSHKYYNQEKGTYGLFGISSRGMENAVRIANQNFDNSLTYEIEFQEFLKSCL